jgi:hypothetical protein
MSKNITEHATLTESTAAGGKAGRFLAQFISPGWGTSGYYSPAVLEQAAQDRVIPAGTHLYADHPTKTEERERPVRSIKDLMAVTLEDAHLTQDGALVGEIQVVPQWRETVEAVMDQIGLSIRGSATDVTIGEAEGRRGKIIEGLAAPVASVDFVTRPGRGGRVLALLESERFLLEATADDRRRQLVDAVKAAYGGPGLWAYVRDQDAERAVVWFEVSREDGPTTTYEQTYAVAANDTAVELIGEPVEVRRLTTYVPINAETDEPPSAQETARVALLELHLEDAADQIKALEAEIRRLERDNAKDVPVNPAGQNNTTQESTKEDPMPQIEEARLRELEEAHGRVPTLEAERDTAARERDDARRELAEARRHAAALDAVREHAHAFNRLEVAGLLANLPLTEAGEFDAEAFGVRLDEHAAAAKPVVKESGRVVGFGATHDDTAEVSESVVPTRTAWGRPLTEQKGA